MRTLTALAACLGLVWCLTCRAAEEGKPVPSDGRSHARQVKKVTMAVSNASPTDAVSGPLQYPVTNRLEQVDDYHGTLVADPYRWLEDVDSPETVAWVKHQAAFTEHYLAALPARKGIKNRLQEVWNYERFGLPAVRGGRYFFTRNDGLQNQSVLYVAEQRDGTPRVLLDPNTFTEDGTVALSGWVPSEDGKRLAYGLATAGSDWQEWKVLDVDTGTTAKDLVQWVKFSSVSWLKDGSGFYYSRYDEPAPGATYTGTNYFQKLYLHRLGEPQAQDQLIYERPDEKEWGFSGHVTDDGKYLVISVRRSTEPKNQVFVQELAVPAAPVVELLTGFDAQYAFVGNEGNRFWFMTDKDAPRKRLIEIRLSAPAPEAWREIVPQSDDVLEDANLVDERFFCLYLKDVSSRVRVYDREGAPAGEIALPGLGSANGFYGRRSDKETFFSYTDFTHPGTIYRVDTESLQVSVFKQPQIPFQPDDYQTEQVFVTSRDGTKVPMFITQRKGRRPDEPRPTVLYGYGGFDISLTPGFSPSNLVWLEAGGIYAVPNLRGGGEYGRPWHEAGMKEKKQNVFDDFIAAAEWLIANQYTTSEQLAIRGGSNGGLLVGAAMTQRPELFAAAVPAVGVMDMLRFHKFTIGWAWVAEFGSADDPGQFPYLYAYSPLHRLRAGQRYPATLVMTADHDDRVVPGHSFKFAAALQAAHAGEKPVLIRIEQRAGHGAGTPTLKLIESSADALAFIAEHTKLSWPSGLQDAANVGE